MEEAFFRTHTYLVEHIDAPVRRTLMDEIDWNDRMIGIKGTRGVGKSTFLLQYAKEHFGPYDRKCLYVNMNNFYFSGHSIVDFANEFQKRGGKVLLIDQVFKHPEWSKELRMCYDRFPNLKIVFTGSSVMRLKEENLELRDIAKSYNLRGFSFREFLNLQTGMKFRAYSLEEILSTHEQIAKGVLSKVRPLDYFQDYLHHGFYPFFLEKRNFSENLLKTMNMMRVKTARFRNSGTFSTFWMFSNTATHPYCSATGSSPGTTTLPPAASIFSLADFVKPLATTVSFFSSSPLPRMRIPS